jgi:hypothetical protein
MFCQVPNNGENLAVSYQRILPVGKTEKFPEVDT